MVDIEPLPEVKPGGQRPLADDRAASSNGKIIRSADAELIFEGQARLNAATEQAIAVLEAAKARYEEETERGYADGRKAGEESIAKLLNDTVANCEQYLASREADLVDLVLTATGSVLERFDDRELARQILKKALKERRAMRGMSLYVHPSGQEAFVKALEDIEDEIGHVDDMISVGADVALEPGMCVLDTPLGYVQLGIEAQLDALRSGLLAAFAANPVGEDRDEPDDDGQNTDG